MIYNLGSLCGGCVISLISLSLSLSIFYLFCSILLDYDFNKLEDIWFTSASNFTMATIELLMDRLPELQSIGILQIFKLYTLEMKTFAQNDDDNLNLHFNSFQGNCQVGT
jgi:hypothetical protein